MSKIETASRKRFLTVMSCFLITAAMYAQASANMSTPFKIDRKSEFHCSEVDEPAIGSPVSHEITVEPTRVKRCDYKQVGSRLNDCQKLKIENATADQYGLVTLDTNKGPVSFSAQEIRNGDDGNPWRVLVWNWPDTDKKYLCTAHSSRR